MSIVSTGTKQMLSFKENILFRLKVPLTIDIVMRIKTIDRDPHVFPTVVADLSKRLTDIQLTMLGKFDVITIEHPPLGVYITNKREIIKDFWDNVNDLLNFGGILAFKRFHFINKDDCYKFGEQITKCHNYLSFSIDNNLLIFTKA
jgi:hypothetical protein